MVSPNYRLGLLLAGYLWLFVLPLSQLGIDTYIDENALQPSQVPSAAPPRTMRTDLCLLGLLVGQHLLELGGRSSCG